MKKYKICRVTLFPVLEEYTRRCDFLAFLIFWIPIQHTPILFRRGQPLLGWEAPSPQRASPLPNPSSSGLQSPRTVSWRPKQSLRPRASLLSREGGSVAVLPKWAPCSVSDLPPEAGTVCRSLVEPGSSGGMVGGLGYQTAPEGLHYYYYQ